MCVVWFNCKLKRIYNTLSHILQSRPFNEKLFRQDLFEQIESPFADFFTDYAIDPQGDTVDIAKTLYDRYKEYVH